MAGSKESGQEREVIEGQPYIDEVITREGGELLFKGRDLWFLCNLHGERTPSGKITSDRIHGHCFGCGWHGDSIDYVRALHGLTFKDALTYLGIEKRQAPADIRAAAQARRERERKTELVRAFREWEQETVNEISHVLRAYRRMRATKTTYTEAELIELARVQGHIDYLEYIYEDILCHSNDEPKFRLYQEMTDAGS